MTDFRNESELVFKSLESEVWREYTFKDAVVRINEPLYINVSSSGGHRVFDNDGISHYIPSGWIHLKWSVKDGKPNFDF